MKILAVSGGIDSVVMLDYLAKNTSEELLVAHFDHGIRSNSHEDAAFVEQLAARYDLPFVCRSAKLGTSCSESVARSARYDFLKSLAKEHSATLCVAHHADDIIESIIINCLRGTGWRGLSPMWDKSIERPLRTWRKAEVYRYAAEHNLHFRQDPTNVEDSYLRNRVREKLINYPNAKKRALIEIYDSQCKIREEIEQILAEIPQQSRYDRTLASEIEALRHVLGLHDVFLTRPQLLSCQKAIMSLAPGKRHSLDREHFIVVNKYTFEITR